MEDAPQQPNDATPPPEGPLDGPGGTAATLIATVDQHSAELDTINAMLLLQAFAFGALVGIVFLQARKLAEVADALAS